MNRELAPCIDSLDSSLNYRSWLTTAFSVCLRTVAQYIIVAEVRYKKTQDTMPKCQNHSVFLFRHCVRSTDLKVHLCHEGSDETRNASDFTASDLADFGVPENWCTKVGMEIMQNTGRFLMNHLLNNNVKSLKVEFISDVVQRDVDTALALSQGMASVVPQDAHVVGLSDLTYDPALFSPLDSSDYYTRTPLCEKTCGVAAAENCSS